MRRDVDPKLPLRIRVSSPKLPHLGYDLSAVHTPVFWLRLSAYDIGLYKPISYLHFTFSYTEVRSINSSSDHRQ